MASEVALSSQLSPPPHPSLLRPLRPASLPSLRRSPPPPSRAHLHGMDRTPSILQASEMGINDIVKGSEGMMGAQTELWSLIFGHIGSMSLKCAVELGIPDAIHRHGKPMALSDLLPALGISPSKAPHMRRLMRMLTHQGVFANGDEESDLYALTPLSAVLVQSNDANLSAFVLAMLHPEMMNPFRSMAAWLKGDEATAFAVQHGPLQFWDVLARDPEFNAAFNKGMESDAKFIIDVLLKDCGHVFEGIGSLVDVGGGTGAAAIAISKAFPSIACSVLDLPHVVDSNKSTAAVEFAAGDMLEYIPPADAVLLKWILHDWNDEECVKILKRCKEAISCGENERGKVIIIDLVMGYDNDHPKSATTQLCFDVMMMVLGDGVERAELEWKKIFDEAGFANYKITPALGLRSVIEVYP